MASREKFIFHMLFGAFHDTPDIIKLNIPATFISFIYRLLHNLCSINKQFLVYVSCCSGCQLIMLFKVSTYHVVRGYLVVQGAYKLQKFRFQYILQYSFQSYKSKQNETFQKSSLFNDNWLRRFCFGRSDCALVSTSPGPAIQAV